MDPRAVRSSPVGKSLVPLPREEARLDPFLGSTIRKSFGAQWYYGQVIAIDVDVASGDRAYHIAYEDGGPWGERVKRFLVIAGRSAPPSDAGGSPHGRRSSMASQRPSLARRPKRKLSRRERLLMDSLDEATALSVVLWHIQRQSLKANLYEEMRLLLAVLQRRVTLLGHEKSDRAAVRI
eukprot:g28577.t1